MNEWLSRNESGSATETTMEHIIQLSTEELTLKERLQVYCKPTYKLRKLKNKGAIIVLIQNFLMFTLYTCLETTRLETKLNPCIITWGITIPLLGRLADVRIGRHNLIRWSIWIMWIAFMLATVSSVVASFITTDIEIVKTVLHTVASAGLGGHQANVIQYGLDQLQDASTDEITAFISWYSKYTENR